MNNKIIYDYEEFEDEMQKILNKSVSNKYQLNEIENNWKTECNLPIKHYTIGNGDKHIVFFGASHGAEIISTEFLLYFMNYIVENETEFNVLLEKYVFDFIPMVNPEGYIITTSAIRTLIPRDMRVSEAVKICNKYRLRYQEDDEDAQNEEIEDKYEKKYQSMFKNATYHNIPTQYIKIERII